MKNVLFIGGSGQLGSKVLSIFSQFHVVNVDFNAHEQAKRNILFKKENSVAENNKFALENVKNFGIKYDAILVTAGGWVGGSIKDEDYLQKVKLMNEVNLYPSLLAAHIATKYLNPNGLIVFTGAASVYKEPQPDMIGYALAKAGVHYLATNLAEKTAKKELIDGKVITILPETIDTPTNRIAMPKADFSKWADPNQIGQLLLSWVSGLNVPANGSFVQLKVKNECIQLEFV
jgi:dihydropteridine reductase